MPDQSDKLPEDDLALATARTIAAVLRAKLDDIDAEVIHLPRDHAALTLGLVDGLVELLSGERPPQP